MSTIRVDTITDEAGTGAPNFPNGLTGDASGLSGLPEPFGYTAVSGATQALDVGSHNFFDAGTLTADTTVSFTNVPTEARWSYSFETGISEGWVFPPVSSSTGFTFSAQTTLPKATYISNDGSKMYILGENIVYQYTVSTPFNVATASYDSVSFSTSSQTDSASGLFFSADGTKMYVVDAWSDIVYQYALSTAFNVSTASYGGVNLSVVSQDQQPEGIFFKSDGTKMYIAGGQTSKILQWNLSTAWDVSSGSYVGSTPDFVPSPYRPTGVFFKSDGTKMYQCDDSSGRTNQWSLSTPWLITTATYDGIWSSSNQPMDVFFRPDGSQMYLTSGNTYSVQVRNTFDLFSLTQPASVANPTSTPTQLGVRQTLDFYTADGGTTVTLIDEEIT